MARSFSQQVYFAHRGLWDIHTPENSHAAFARAIAHGYGIECDVRLNADGVPVVFHDEGLKRMTGDGRRLAQCTYEELSQRTLQGSTESIPTLQSVLTLVDGRVPLYIEIKGGQWKYRLKTHKIMRALENYKGPYIIASFDARIVSMVARAYHVPAVQIFYHAGIHKQLWSKMQWYAYGHRGTAMSVHVDAFSHAFFTTRSKKYQIFLWTAQTHAAAVRAASEGDFVIFERCLP